MSTAVDKLFTTPPDPRKNFSEGSPCRWCSPGGNTCFRFVHHASPPPPDLAHNFAQGGTPRFPRVSCVFDLRKDFSGGFPLGTTVPKLFTTPPGLAAVQVRLPP
jgi:hypothetical protein